MTLPINEPSLHGMSVAILVVDGFEQIELTAPRDALDEAGATTKIISVRPGKVQGFNHDVKADQFDVGLTFNDAYPDDFDAVLLPGGVLNSDQLRSVPEAQRFVQAMQQSGKPIAVICHGGWLLVSAGLVKGRSMTSWPTLQDDIRHAGGNWLDQEVVVDGNLISSRKPADIPAFNRKMIEVFGERVRASLHGSRDERVNAGVSS